MRQAKVKSKWLSYSQAGRKVDGSWLRDSDGSLKGHCSCEWGRRSVCHWLRSGTQGLAWLPTRSTHFLELPEYMAGSVQIPAMLVRLSLAPKSGLRHHMGVEDLRCEEKCCYNSLSVAEYHIWSGTWVRVYGSSVLPLQRFCRSRIIPKWTVLVFVCLLKLV